MMIASSLLAAALVSLAAFPMGGGNAQRTGYIDVEAPSEAPAILWAAPLGAGTETAIQPVLDEAGNVYTAAAADGVGAFVSFDRNGAERWRWTWTQAPNPGVQQTSMSQLGIPVLTPDNGVAMGFRGGWLRAWDRDSGDLRWERDLSDDAEHLTCAPVIDQAGFIYVYVRNRPVVVKVDSRDGTVVWAARFADGDERGHGSSPSLSPDESTLYIGRVGHDVARAYAMATADGAHRWSWFPAEFRDHTFTWPLPAVAPEGTVYMQDEYFARVYAIGADGAHRWTFSREGSEAPRAAALADGVFYTSYGADPPTVVAIGPDGTAFWERRLDEGGMVGGLAALRDAVVFGVTGAGKVYALNRADGSVRWTKALGCASFSEGPAVRDDGAIYIGTDGAAGVAGAAIVVLK